MAHLVVPVPPSGRWAQGRCRAVAATGLRGLDHALGDDHLRSGVDAEGLKAQVRPNRDHLRDCFAHRVATGLSTPRPVATEVKTLSSVCSARIASKSWRRQASRYCSAITPGETAVASVIRIPLA